MTVFEMHIALNQRYQEIASYKRDKLRPEEIDLVLNKAMYRLLQRGVETDFQDDQINLSHVSALLHKNKTSDLIIPAETDKNYEQHNPGGYHTFPSDFYWLVSGGAEVVTNKYECDTLPELTTSSFTEQITLVVFPAAGSTAPYFGNASITTANLGLMYTSPAGIAAGFNSPNSKYVLLNNIIDAFYRRNVNIRVFWERYRDVHYPNTLVFVSSISLGTITFTAGGISSVGNPVSNNYSFYNRASITDQHITKFKPLKVVEGDRLHETRQNAFYATNEDEVTASQSHDYLIVYRGESFIVTRIYYDYIRKPRTISLVLNQSCELASTVHERIIDMAVEILRVDTKQQNYEATVHDINLRT